MGIDPYNGVKDGDSMEFTARKPNRLTEYDYNQNGAYFVTICTQDRKKILSKLSVGTPVLGCPNPPDLELLWHGRIADRYIQQMNTFYKHISVDKYVIMPDHIHLLISINAPFWMGIPPKPSREIFKPVFPRILYSISCLLWCN